MKILNKLKSFAKILVYKIIGPKIFYRTVTLSNGFKIKVDITDLLGRKIYKEKKYDSFEIEIAKKLIKKGDICIDIGANIGIYTLTMSSCVGDTGKVFSFEPIPQTFDVLSDNIKLNYLKNVILQNKGISDESGDKQFFVTLQSGLSGMGDTGRGTVVQKKSIETLTIDGFVSENNLQNIDFIKIDVEGFEYKVLRGMKNALIEQKNLILMVELDDKNFESFGFSVKDTINWMNKIGYSAWSINRENSSLVLLSDDKNYFGVNFIFAKKDSKNFQKISNIEIGD